MSDCMDAKFAARMKMLTGSLKSIKGLLTNRTGHLLQVILMDAK